jgi:hypothetical protein
MFPEIEAEIHNSRQVIVAGSKRAPVFSTYTPDIFVGVSGAISHAKKMSIHTRKWGVISNYVLCSTHQACDITRREIFGTQLDRLFIISAIPQRYEDLSPAEILGHKVRAITRLKTLQCSMAELKYLGLGYFREELASLRIRKIGGLMLQFLCEGTTYKTRLSTGMWTVLAIRQRMQVGAHLEVAGIGLTAASSYFIDSNGQKFQGHQEQDRYVAKKMFSSSTGPIVKFTDEDAIKVICGEQARGNAHE